MPPEAAMTSLDHDRRLRNRIAKRKTRNITWRVKDTRHGMRMTDDTIEAHIRIIPGKVQSGLAKRLPVLRQKRVVDGR